MQVIIAILIVFLIKIIIDKITPAFRKSKSDQKGEFIDISAKWINADEMPYKKNEYLLDNRELVVFQMIKDILDKSCYTVYPHLCLADLLKVPMGTQNRPEYLYRIKERSLDMVILESSRLRPVLAVNLKSQGDGKKQQISSQFTENALKSAGLKYINIDLNDPPSHEQIRSNIRELGLDL